MNPIFCTKSGDEFIFVFRSPPEQIVGHPGIQVPRTARQDVNAKCPVHFFGSRKQLPSKCSIKNQIKGKIKMQFPLYAAGRPETTGRRRTTPAAPLGMTCSFREPRRIEGGRCNRPSHPNNPNALLSTRFGTVTCALPSWRQTGRTNNAHRAGRAKPQGDTAR
jgi:hypothetical protein